MSPDGGMGGITGLPTSCLSPCHGFSGIVEQWKTSTHYAVFILTIGTEEVDSWTGPNTCGNCHATDGLAGRAAGSVGTAGGATVSNVTSGHLGYRSASGAYAESTYTGNSKTAQVACLTCHSITDATDPHRTGMPYDAASGVFAQRARTGATDQVYIEKSPDTSGVTGTAIGALGSSNTCVWCHRSRKDPTNYILASQTLTSPNWGPHEGPQADLYSGQGGYHFSGQSYGTSTHQLRTQCVDCHMPPVMGNSKAPNHSFYAQLDSCTATCHAGATTFDISGGQTQIAATLTDLKKALNAAGYLTRSTAAPYAALSGAQLTDANYELDKTRPGGGIDGGPSVLTADKAGALYDYLLVARDHSLGIHNPKYTKQLLFDAYFAIAGEAPPTLPIRPQ